MIIRPLSKPCIALTALFAAAGVFAATAVAVPAPAPAAVVPMTKAQYQTQKDQISAAYKVDKAACDGSKGNAKDICKEQAKGKEKVARAELEYGYETTASHSKDVKIAKADSAFSVAKEVCDDKAGNTKDVCRAEAKAAHVKALTDAKLVDKVVTARKDAAQDKLDADYKVAAEKCDSLAGDPKAACIGNAKVRYSQH